MHARSLRIVSPSNCTHNISDDRIRSCRRTSIGLVSSRWDPRETFHTVKETFVLFSTKYCREFQNLWFIYFGIALSGSNFTKTKKQISIITRFRLTFLRYNSYFFAVVRGITAENPFLSVIQVSFNNQMHHGISMLLWIPLLEECWVIRSLMIFLTIRKVVESVEAKKWCSYSTDQQSSVNVESASDERFGNYSGAEFIFADGLRQSPWVAIITDRNFR